MIIPIQSFPTTLSCLGFYSISSFSWKRHLFHLLQKVSILEFDKTKFHIRAAAYGEEFQIGKHPQGSEVKAITYSNMQIHDNEGKFEVFVIIDI